VQLTRKKYRVIKAISRTGLIVFSPSSRREASIFAARSLGNEIQPEVITTPVAGFYGLYHFIRFFAVGLLLCAAVAVRIGPGRQPNEGLYHPHLRISRQLTIQYEESYALFF